MKSASAIFIREWEKVNHEKRIQNPKTVKCVECIHSHFTDDNKWECEIIGVRVDAKLVRGNEHRISCGLGVRKESDT
jgi:hypothetical protein